MTKYSTRILVARATLPSKLDRVFKKSFVARCVLTVHVVLVRGEALGEKVNVIGL